MNLIKVIAWSNKKISKHSTEASFYLEQDDWNDFDFHTTYHLHISSIHTTDGRPVYVGPVKILKKKQKHHQIYLIPKGILNSLSGDFISLGLSLDYYQRVAQLGKDLSTILMLALNDAAYNQNRIKDFEDEEGWSTSLLRDMSIDNDIFQIAPLMIKGDFDTLLSIDLKFNFNMPGLEAPIEFDFSSPKYGWNDTHLPNRVAVLIGRNGSGKSTLLSKISKIAFASSKDRQNQDLQDIGSVYPEGLGFPKIINISYSSFDSFQVPGIYKHEKEQIAREISTGKGRYIFCGFRDIVKELKESLKILKTDNTGKLNRSEILKERSKITYLKSIEDLSNEFIQNIVHIKGSNKYTLFDKSLGILYKEPSMHFLNDWDLYKHESELYNEFLNLSTGHKFIIHSISCIVRYTEPRSLILFDEPETHLHPPVLAALMNAIRVILETTNSFMITATHSPVILQETLKSNINIIRREGNFSKISKPEIQTFGENIGLITSTVFGLASETSDYHRTLNRLVREFKEDFRNLSNEETLNQIEELFEGGLSMQARAYLMSRIYSTKN